MPPPPHKENTKTQWVVNEALRARTAIIISLAALLGAGVSLAKAAVGVPAVTAALGLVGVLLLLVQIAGRSFLMQLQQEHMLLKTENAADALRIIQRNTEEELRAEQKQSLQLEFLFTAMREFNLLQVESFERLSESRPTTSFYLQRQASSIVDVLKGRWDRSELLRPAQLWREYAKLMEMMRGDEIFRSTVCIPPDPADLFNEPMFTKYANEIRKAADPGERGVKVKRLFVFNREVLPPDGEALEPAVLKHLQELQDLEAELSTLEVRVTTKSIASTCFNRLHPDLMIWGNGLLILSDLSGPKELVTQAEFYFSGNNYTKEIADRQRQFDELFASPEEAFLLNDVLSPA
jgi:hypothetical protein